MAGSASLLPKEHGAYAQLAFPLVTGWALAGFSPSALVLGLASVAFFLANEPVAVLLGVRGKRLQGQLGIHAKTRASGLLGGGVVLGLLGVGMAGASVWPELALPVCAAVLLVPLALLGKQKTLLGELVAVTAFATLLLPLAAVGGAQGTRAALAAGVWWISFALGTLEVHAIKARHKKTAKKRWTRWGSPLAAGITVGAAVWLALGQAGPVLRDWTGDHPSVAGSSGVVSWVPEAVRLLPPAAAALLPPVVAILALSLARVHPKHLKRVGWTLVGANLLTFILLLQG